MPTVVLAGTTASSVTSNLMPVDADAAWRSPLAASRSTFCHGYSVAGSVPASKSPTVNRSRSSGLVLRICSMSCAIDVHAAPGAGSQTAFNDPIVIWSVARFCDATRETSCASDVQTAFGDESQTRLRSLSLTVLSGLSNGWLPKLLLVASTSCPSVVPLYCPTSLTFALALTNPAAWASASVWVPQ